MSLRDFGWVAIASSPLVTITMFIVEVMAILSARKLNSSVLSVLLSLRKPFQLVGVLLFPETLLLIPLPDWTLLHSLDCRYTSDTVSVLLYLREQNSAFGGMFSLAYSSKVFDFSGGVALTIAETSMIMASACGSKFGKVTFSSRISTNWDFWHG